MGEPTEYLPDCSIEDITNQLLSIEFPTAESIIELKTGGEYHRIFRLTYTPVTFLEIIQRTSLTSLPLNNHLAGTDTSNTSFILRVSGRHFPNIKTANEVGILTYVTKHTSIPVPQIIHYDDTIDNALHNEYMIMTLLPGRDGSTLYRELSQTQFSHILDQLVTICLELYKLEFDHIGGLRPDLYSRSPVFPQTLLDCPIIPGPPVVETMWQSPDIDRHFNTVLPSSEPQSFATLNAASPDGYPSYTTWLAAQTQVYIHALTIHPSLIWVREQDPHALRALTDFTTRLRTDAALQARLNDIPYKLAHRDLHFGNILLSPRLDQDDTGQNEVQYTITGVLDWEFSAVVPFPLWRPGFLYSGIRAPDPDWLAPEREARARLFEIWAQKVARSEQEEGRKMLKEDKWRNNEQGSAWDVVNYLRCVVEVCPRGKQEDDARRWWDEVKKGLGVFGIEM